MKSILLLTISLTLTLANATEIDSFTNRHIPLEDSLNKLNSLTNKVFKETVEGLSSCDKMELYNEINGTLGGFLWAELENEIEKSKDFEKRYFDRSNSIYKELSFIQFFPHYLVEMGSVFNVNGHLIGIDKIGHFIGIGFNYFKIAFLEKKGIEAALEFGESTERGFFGTMTTGVYSYGDLAANYKGMLFWTEILGKKPYVHCDGNKWKVVREIKWENYIDASLDEGVNCNDYRNQDFENRVFENIKKLEYKDPNNRQYICPLNRSVCTNLRKKFAPYSNRILNPRC